MISAEPLAPVPDDRQVSRALAALVLAMLLLFGAFAATVFLATLPRLDQKTAPQAALPRVAPDAFATDRPACAAALKRAQASRSLPSDEAITANTAMLRACRRS